jgi:cell division protein ZapD
VALLSLFDILEVTARSDLKSDLLQELERQRQAVISYRDKPGVSFEALSRVLADIEAAATALSETSGKAGQHLRENEWLMQVRGRTNIPGGANEFDVPSYHAWRNRPSEVRLRDLGQWFFPLRPLRDALRITLRLLRQSGQRSSGVAQSGSYQQQLGGKTYQLLQVRIEDDSQAIPELSANRHMLWLRFTSQGGDLRPRAFEGNVAFEMTLCNF